MNWLDPRAGGSRPRGQALPGRGPSDSTWGWGEEGPCLNPDSLGNLRHVLLLYFYRNSADTAFSVSMEGLPTAPMGQSAHLHLAACSQAAAMCSK